MHIVKKLDYKKFIPITLLVNIFFLFFARNKMEVIVILTVYMASIINIAMLHEAISDIIVAAKPGGPPASKGKVVLLFLFKLIILIGAITWGVQFMEKRIIIPIFNYIVHIFVLSLCVKKG